MLPRPLGAECPGCRAERRRVECGLRRKGRKCPENLYTCYSFFLSLISPFEFLANCLPFFVKSLYCEQRVTCKTWTWSLEDSLSPRPSFSFSAECPQQESDIAFLIDGSGSINSNDFLKMKQFVSTVMNQFTKSKTLVRASGLVRE